MSDYQTNVGKIKEVSLDLECGKVNSTIEDFMKFKLDSISKDYEKEEWLRETFRDYFYDDYFQVKDKMYEILENQQIAPEDEQCHLIKNEDGSYSFNTTFYNGGGDEVDMLQSKLSKLQA